MKLILALGIAAGAALADQWALVNSSNTVTQVVLVKDGDGPPPIDGYWVKASTTTGVGQKYVNGAFVSVMLDTATMAIPIIK